MNIELETTAVQWFPGHMAKTRRLIRDNLKLVDIAVELRDARIPRSSENPEIARLLGQKPRLVLLNKNDMADPDATAAWCRWFEKQSTPVLAVDCRSGKGLSGFAPKVNGVLHSLLEARRNRGIVGRPIRLMIVGVPNVGKSSLINRLAGGRRAKVEDRPGVTKAKQWIKVQQGMELLDTPGVLWPKFEDPQVGENLAFTGAVKDDVVDIEALATRLIARLAADYPALLAARYKLEPGEWENLPPHDLLALVGQKRGMLLPGGEINTERAAITLLDEFRSGRIGRITLESPGKPSVQEAP